jgi:RNA polymerase sigma-70 factor (ECF subfamily)
MRLGIHNLSTPGLALPLPTLLTVDASALRSPAAVPFTPLSDDALIARVASGDTDAFSALYRRYERPVFAVLLRLGGQRALAEEWLQEAFTRVWLAAATHDTARGAVKPWIYAIALNTARSELARKRHRAPHLSLDEPGLELPDAAGGERGLAARLDERRHAAELAAAVRGLPDYLREVVVLRCSRELSFAEIAEVTGAPEGTLKSRFHRAVVALRAAVRGREGGVR